MSSGDFVNEIEPTSLCLEGYSVEYDDETQAAYGSQSVCLEMAYEKIRSNTRCVIEECFPLSTRKA